MIRSADDLRLPDIPSGWKVIRSLLDGYAVVKGNLAVIVSVSVELDGKVWWHISVSNRHRTLPSWRDVRMVKDIFVGRERTALIVLPPEGKYVNIAEVHHIWHCVSGDVVPDFTHGSNSI